MLADIDTTGFGPTQYKTYYNAQITLFTALGNKFGTDEEKAKGIEGPHANKHLYILFSWIDTP